MSKLGKPLIAIAIATVLLALSAVVLAPMFAGPTTDAVVVSGPDRAE